jgi:hypothetical protein
MKFLSEYTDKEKAKRFDAIYKHCIEHINAERAQDEPDPDTFIDNIAEQALDVKGEEWDANKVNQGLIYAQIMLS